MSSDNILSSSQQLQDIARFTQSALLLPFFEGVPGKVLERIFAYVHRATVLGTYDFVDVVDLEKRIGWQIKSTQHGTPVTWKRAKIPAKQDLIRASEESEEGRRILG